MHECDRRTEETSVQLSLIEPNTLPTKITHECDLLFSVKHSTSPSQPASCSPERIPSRPASSFSSCYATASPSSPLQLRSPSGPNCTYLAKAHLRHQIENQVDPRRRVRITNTKIRRGRHPFRHARRSRHPRFLHLHRHRA